MFFLPDADTFTHPSTWTIATTNTCHAVRPIDVQLACTVVGGTPQLFVSTGGAFPDSGTATITTFTTSPFFFQAIWHEFQFTITP
jgi:hypothetical protein